MSLIERNAHFLSLLPPPPIIIIIIIIITIIIITIINKEISKQNKTKQNKTEKQEFHHDPILTNNWITEKIPNTSFLKIYFNLSKGIKDMDDWNKGKCAKYALL